MNSKKSRRVVAGLLLALVLSCAKEELTAPNQAAPPAANTTSTGANSVTKTDDQSTPFQRSIANVIAQRKAQNLPVPADVSFEYAGPSTSALQQQTGQPGEQVTITARTTIQFENPAQAGLEKWSGFVVEGALAPGADGYIKEGDYTQFVKDKVAEQNPGVWERYEFGYEPRTYVFNETITMTYPKPGDSPQSTSTTEGEGLMGFTFVGPDIHDDIGGCITVAFVDVGCFHAGYDFDYGLGLRLPMELSLTSTDPLAEGSTYYPTSSAGGLDWSADDYDQIDVAPENGNEFVLRLEMGAHVTLSILGADLVNENYGLYEDHSVSAATPFGPGATFDLPAIDLPIYCFCYGVGSLETFLSVTPQFGSEKFTTDWSATGDGPGKATGGGQDLTYTDPNLSVQVGPLNALDGPGYANITLDDFRYYFSVFQLDPCLGFKLSVFGYGVDSWCINMPGIDLSAITQDLSVGSHTQCVLLQGCTDAPGTITASVFIENVAPTAAIDLTGAVPVNGVPTFMTNPGDVLTFVGMAADPGQDDITMMWDWDDGLPSPDASTTYPVPYQVTESQSHAFGDACLYWVTLKAEDDDQAFGTDQVPVVITPEPGSSLARREGYWQHEFAQVGNTDWEIGKLECFLGIVSHMSAVFDEARDVSSVANAYQVLFLQHNYDSLVEQLDRELLVAWMNFASGAFGYTQLLDTDADGVSDTPFVGAIAAAEAVRLNPGATVAELEAQITIVHNLSRRNA